MENNPLISVIMGVYNCKDKKMLLDSVQSIIDQTFKDWEFIICNDGSSNNTLEILDEIAKLDVRIKIISYDENHGLAYALNECLKHAKGKYIARQDDDDISYPDRLQKQYDFISNHNEYAIVGTCADVFDNGGIWGAFMLEEYPAKNTFLWNSPFIHPSVLFEKDALIASEGYRVAKETRRCEDYDLFMRMYSLGYKGCNLQEKLYKYRILLDNGKYRPMKYRIDEAKVRYIGFKKMNLGIKSIPYIVKPIIIGLIPQKLFRKIRKKNYSADKEA